MNFQLSRRRFLQMAGVAIASGPVLSACSDSQSHGAHVPAPQPGQIETSHPVGGEVPFNNKVYPFTDPVTGESLYHEQTRFAPHPGLQRTPRTTPVNLLEQQPPRVESRDGVLNLDLDVKFADVVVNGQTMNLRTYNGSFPGPTIVAKPGDTLHVREINSLPPEVVMPHADINHPHGFNDVNLHTHGLNVNPEDSEDNVLLTIHPGETFDHQIHVPGDHPTGTFWYHPHKHGASACQVGSGMAGLLLLTDPKSDVRSLPEIGATREVVPRVPGALHQGPGAGRRRARCRACRPTSPSTSTATSFATSSR